MSEGHRKRVRKRFVSEGLDSFEEHQILELLLHFTIPRRDTNPIAHDLLKKFGSLAMIFESKVEDLIKIDGIGEQSAVLLSMIPGITRAYFSSKNKPRPALNNSMKAAQYIKNLFIGRTYECFYIICLDIQKRVIYSAMLPEGTIDETPVYTRIVVEIALRYKAHSVILAHNHPGGIPMPSGSDIDVTQNLVNALDPVHINVVDHFIATDSECVSFSSMGLI